MNRKSKAFWAEVGRAIPGLEAVAGEVAGQTVEHLLGFWVLWHTTGGLEPLIGQKVISRSSVYSQRSQFHRIMHVEVENFWPEAVAFMAAERVRLSSLAAAP
jgi:hypothetical protein